MENRKRKSRFDTSSSSSESSDESSYSTSSLKIRAPKGKFLMTFKRTVDHLTKDSKKMNKNLTNNSTTTNSTVDDEDGSLLPNAILLIGTKHTRVKVMKEILQIQSPILKARLSDAAAASSAKVYKKSSNDSSGNDDFPVFYFEDIELEPFQNFLRYLYSTESTWNWSMLKVKSKKNLVTSILSLKHLARKLAIKNLEEEIDKSLESFTSKIAQGLLDMDSNSESNKMTNGKMLCEIFQQAQNFEFIGLNKIALQTILKVPKCVFQDIENYKFLEPQSLAEILLNDDLEATDELELFHLVLNWSKAQTLNYEGEQQEMLKIVLPSIRFTQMTLDEFMEHVFPTQILDNGFIGRIIPFLYWKDHQNEISPPPSSDIKLEKVRKYTSITNSLATLLPLKLWARILQYLTKKELMICRQICKHFQKVVDEQFSLEILLDENLLDKIAGTEFIPTEEKPHLHSFSRVITFIEKFQTENFEFLLRFIEFSKSNVESKSETIQARKNPDLFLDLNMDCVSNHLSLIKFLTEVMIRAPSLKINLKISSIDEDNCENKSRPKNKVDFDSDSDESQTDTESETSDSESNRSTDETNEITNKFGLNSNFPPESLSTSFFQIICISFEFLHSQVELECLIQMTRQCPNLNEISLGNFIRRTKFEDVKQTPNLVEFLKMANLDKLKLSMANLGHHQLTMDFFQDLKLRQVIFKKVNVDYDNRIKTLKFVNIFSDHLEEIYDLQIQVLATIKCLLNPLPKLKVLSVNCSVQWLLFVLQKTPELESLFWSEIRSTEAEGEDINCLEWTQDDQLTLTVANNSAIQLKNLMRIVISIKREENFQLLKFLSVVCPNVKSISFEISLPSHLGGIDNNEKDNNLTGNIWIYKYFSKLEKLEICESQESAMIVITGFTESELENRHKNPNNQDRPPYIGNLKNLRILNLGLMDYQELAKRWKWRINFGLFYCGIGHLTKLQEITFPPLELVLAKRILTFLESKMKTVKCVRFQVWALEKRDNRNGTMTIENVTDLKERFGSWFESIEVVQLLQNDAVHYTTWI